MAISSEAVEELQLRRWRGTRPLTAAKHCIRTKLQISDLYLSLLAGPLWHGSLRRSDGIRLYRLSVTYS